MSQERRGGHHDVGAGKQEADEIVGTLDPGGRCEVDAKTLVQQGDPRTWRPAVLGA